MTRTGSIVPLVREQESSYRPPTSIANILRQKFTRHTELFRAGEKLTCKHCTASSCCYCKTPLALLFVLLESCREGIIIANTLMSRWVSLNVKFWQHEGNFAFMTNLFVINVVQTTTFRWSQPIFDTAEITEACLDFILK